MNVIALNMNTKGAAAFDILFENTKQLILKANSSLNIYINKIAFPTKPVVILRSRYMKLGLTCDVSIGKHFNYIATIHNTSEIDYILGQAFLQVIFSPGEAKLLELSAALVDELEDNLPVARNTNGDPIIAINIYQEARINHHSASYPQKIDEYPMRYERPYSPISSISRY
jgi:hypothetical protein